MTITDPTGREVPDPSNTSHYEPDETHDDQAAEDLATLVELVADMRNAQREYFRTRSSTALGASKRAEKLVDKHLADISKGTNQARLF